MAPVASANPARVAMRGAGSRPSRRSAMSVVKGPETRTTAMPPRPRGSRDSCDCVSGPRKVHRPVKPAGAAGTSGLADDFLRDHPLLNDGQNVVDEPVENESRREEEEEEREDEG